MAITGPESLGAQIADALGLKHCRKLSLHFEVNAIPTVEAECFLTDSSTKITECIGKRYRLVEADEKPPEPPEPLDDTGRGSYAVS